MTDSNVREAAVSGQFYPNSVPKLKALIASYMSAAKIGRIHGNLKAIIVPHAGYIYSGPIAAYGYAALAKIIKDIRKIIILGPSHFVYLHGFVADNNEFWETPLGKVRLMENELPKMDEAHAQEHSIEVQVPFIQTLQSQIEILPIVAGDGNPVEIANAIMPLIDERTFLIVSSDLSHYLPYETAKAKDLKTINAIKKLDYNAMVEQGDACGKIPILTLIAIAKELKWKPTLLDYRNSGDTAGDKTKVVGYASFAFAD